MTTPPREPMPQLASAPARTAVPSDYLSLDALRARYGKTHASYIVVEGVEVYYIDEGIGPALLMVHGSSSSAMTYDALADVLKDRYRVIRYDIPPQGLSGPVADAAAMKLSHVDIPQALLEHLCVSSVTVIGVSSGGTMAYFLAAARPDLVERLVISNAPAALVDTRPMRLSKALAAEQAIAGEASNGSFKRRLFWDAFWDFFAGEPDRVGAAIRDQFYDMNRRLPEANRFALTAMTREQGFTIEAAAKVRCPVLLLWGARDPLLPVAAAEVLKQYLCNADTSLIVLPDVGHYPPIEAPERYGQIVHTFIREVTPFAPIAVAPADR